MRNFLTPQDYEISENYIFNKVTVRTPLTNSPCNEKRGTLTVRTSFFAVVPRH